jgi:quinoprotein glucose dehydrogenase
MDFVMVGGAVPRVRGLPLIKPPYSRVTAIDLKTGNHAWMVAAGDTPEAIRSNAALAGVQVPRTGSHARPLLLVTATLLFSAEGVGGAPVLHALDKMTGATIHELRLEGQVGSQPMTYMVNGRQYVAFWVSDTRSNTQARLVAYALPR